MGREWQKKLYIRQPFPDNHVDGSFLREMKKNVHVPMYSYAQLVSYTLPLLQHISTIVSFLALFHRLQLDLISPAQLVTLTNGLSMAGYFAWMLWVRRTADADHRQWGKQTAKSGLLLLLIILAMSPILRTLTEDTSSDTIGYMVMGCFLLNLIFTDHTLNPTSTNSFVEWEGRPAQSHPAPMGKGIPSPLIHGRQLAAISFSGTGSLGLNAAVFASVMLASRLTHLMHVFGLITLSLLSFALLPILRALLRRRWGWPLDAILAMALTLTALALLHPLYPSMALAHLVLTLLISLAAPLWFLHLQRYKNEIHGPWDEARVVLSGNK